MNFYSKNDIMQNFIIPSIDEILNHISYAIKILANQTTKSQNHDF